MGTISHRVVWLIVSVALLTLPVLTNPAVLANPAVPTNPAVLQADRPVIQLDQGQLQALRDPTHALSLNSVRAAFERGQFQTLPANLGMGYTPDAAWLTFFLDRQPAQPSRWWLEVLPPYLDDIQLFRIAPDGRVDQRRAGDFKPQRDKEEPYRGNLFKLDLQPGQHQFYIRIKTTSTAVAIIKLWQPLPFIEHMRNSYFAFGIYFGLILSVLLFNTASWLVSRRSIFFAYVVYLLLNALQWLAINGFVADFVFPTQPLLANLTLGLCLSLSAAMAFVFFAMVFELRRYHPVVYIINRAGLVAALLTAAATPFGYFQAFVPWLLGIALLSIVATFWPMWRLWRTQEWWSRLLVFGYCAFALLVMINILSTLGVLPFSRATLYAGMLSNLFHIMLLHFAILLHYRSELERYNEELEQRVAKRTMALRDANQKLERLSITDALTEIANRRHFDQIAATEWSRAMRSHLPLAIIMLDVDFFKSYNDRYGHQAGDIVLKRVAGVLASGVRRAGDLAARYGGEEFVIIAPNTDTEQAQSLAEMIRHGVEAMSIPNERAALGVLTISIGIFVTSVTEPDGLNQALKRADQALYQAKASGRNCVEVEVAVESPRAT